MGIISSKLTVMFEDPFWIGLYERNVDNKYEVCKITFGAEPKDYEVYDFLLVNIDRLRFSSVADEKISDEKHKNPKRVQREIKKQLEVKQISTKAQRALQEQHELLKTERKQFTKEQREQEKREQFRLKQEKHKEKHKGH